MAAHEVSRGGSYYINEFLRLRCGGRLLEERVFPNVAEVEESFSAFHAVSDALHNIGRAELLRAPDVIMLAPGDGKTPRTALTFALRTAWTCHSVDPAAVIVDRPDVRRVTVWSRRVEDVPVEAMTQGARLTVIVAVHSHAQLEPLVARVSGPRLIVAMPCCIPQRALGRPPRWSYEDPGVSSPKRRVDVWTEALDAC